MQNAVGTSSSSISQNYTIETLIDTNPGHSTTQTNAITGSMNGYKVKQSQSAGLLHQLHDRSANVGNEEELPAINSLSISDKKIFVTGRSEKPIKLNDSTPEAITLPQSASYLSDDSHHKLMDSNTNTQLLVIINKQRDRITQGLNHTFEGTDKAFKRKLKLHGITQRYEGKAAAGLAVAGVAFVAGVAATAASAGLLTVPLVIGGTIIGVLYPGTTCSFAYIAGTRQSHKYFAHETKWFKHFVDERHRALFLKENPAQKDIEDLEKLVTETRERLHNQFSETCESVAQALKIKKGGDVRLQKKLRHAADILNIYLDEAKKRHALHQTANTDLRECEDSDNSSDASDSELSTTIGTTCLTEARGFDLDNMRTEGIDNPAFIIDSE